MTKENFDAKVTLAAEKLKEEVEPLKECSVNAIKKALMCAALKMEEIRYDRQRKILGES